MIRILGIEAQIVGGMTLAVLVMWKTAPVMGFGRLAGGALIALHPALFQRAHDRAKV